MSSSEMSQPSTSSPEDTARIVYHAENRTFARLFNERSLEQVKDVVRQKLKLERDVDVSLKQMGADALLDLEDEDDFRAFRFLLKSRAQADIQVTVGGKSQTPAVPPAEVVPRRRDGAVASREPVVQPEATKTSARKRKVSFGDAAAAPKPQPAIAPVESAAGTAADPDEPTKKKRKKETTKGVKSADVVESTSAKAVPKSRSKKSATVVAAGDAATKDAETTEPAKKKKKQSGGGTGRKKSSTSVDPVPDNVGGKPDKQPANDPGNEISLQPVLESEMPRVVPKGMVCASIPKTSESRNVQSEVAAAIISDYFSLLASGSITPDPPAKPKSVKKSTKKSSSALTVESTVVDVPVDETSKVPTKKPTHQVSELNGPPCPICLETPFHIRYCCPIVTKGPDAIRVRLEELKRMNAEDEQTLIKELEGLLLDSKVASRPSPDATSNDIQSRQGLAQHSSSSSSSRNMPSNTCEVTVESRNEGSSSESSDETSEEEAERDELPASRKQASDARPLLTDDGLEDAIRGSEPKRKSILDVLDRIVGLDDEDSDSEEVEAVLEEDETDRPRRRLSPIPGSSNSESEDEESRSSLPSHSAQGNSDLQDSNNEPADDVIMRDAADRVAPGGQGGDSSEETHVGSDDRMVVDESIGEKGAATTVEEHQPSRTSKASTLRSTDASEIEPQESAQPEANSSSNRDGGIPILSGVRTENDADPIEAADDSESPAISRSKNTDPIEAPSEDLEALLTGGTQTMPKPGLTRRIKTRDGLIPDDEAEAPVLLEQLATEVTMERTPLPAKVKSRKKDTAIPSSQEPVTLRKSSRLGLHPSTASTPAAVTLLDHRARASGKAFKTPAKRPEDHPGASQSNSKGDKAQNRAQITPAPSLNTWETLAEPSSPSVGPDVTPARVGELVSSSPQGGRLNERGKGSQARKSALVTPAESSRGKERLFDLSSSQIPFPYSQYQDTPTPMTPQNAEDKGKTTEEEEGEERKTVKRKTRPTARYRSLSQLASNATLFTPGSLTRARKSTAGEKTNKLAVVEASSSSSSSDTDGNANGSEHIPRGRRAGSVLETRKSKGVLSKI